MSFASKIHFNDNGIETLRNDEPYETTFFGGDGSKDRPYDDFDTCLAYTKTLLRLESNQWCDFAHGGDCSFAGIYQPPIPKQSPHGGEFFAFANYLHVWKFNKLPIKTTVPPFSSTTQLGRVTLTTAPTAGRRGGDEPTSTEVSLARECSDATTQLGSVTMTTAPTAGRRGGDEPTSTEVSDRKNVV